MTVAPMTTATKPANTTTSPASTEVASDPFDAYRRLVTDPAVKSFLFARIKTKKKVPESMHDELVGVVLRKLWDKRDDPKRPTKLARVIGLAKKMLDDLVVDYLRRVLFEKKHFVDPPKAAGVAPQQIDFNDQPNFVDELAPLVTRNPEKSLQIKEKLDFVRAMRERGILTDDDIEVMAALDAGETTYEELAAPRGTTAGALRVHIARVRDRIDHAWREHDRTRIRVRGKWVLVVLVVLVFGAMALALGRKSPPPPMPRPRTEAPRTHHDTADDLVMPHDVDKK